MTLLYTRALHPDDYDHPDLVADVTALRAFEASLWQRGTPYRKDHHHRDWEYGNALRQCHELGINQPGTKVLDTGSGGSYFALYLRAVLGFDVTVEDSMTYGSIVETVILQCQQMGLTLPIISDPLERMVSVPDSAFDLVTCISTIEHVGAAHYEEALHELARVAKDGGFVFLTSDYFRDEGQADLSPFRSIQETRYTEALVRQIPVIEPRLQFVGGVDLTYRGDWVHNYSFFSTALKVEK